MSRPPARPRYHHNVPRRVVSPLVTALVAVGLSGLVLVGSPVVPAGAQEISVTRLQRDIADNSARIDDLTRQARDAQARADVLATDIDATQTHLDQTRLHAVALKEQIRSRMAAIYITGRHGALPVTDAQSFSDAASARHYGNDVTQIDRSLQTELLQNAESLDADVAHLRDAKAEADSQKAASLAARNQAEDLLTRQKTLLAALDVIPLMGTARLSARQMADWYDSTGFVARLSDGMTIRDLAGIYLQEGADEGVRGDLAFAQSILETGYFRGATDNNYSGLGACDSCSGEPAFPSPRDGVRAQIQLLKNYGDPDSTTATLHHPPQATWWGSDPGRAAHNFDTFYAKGRAQTWQAMGKGNWATDPNYSAKVIGIFIRMSVFAADHA